MADIGRSTSAHVEEHEIESSQAWIELEHWGLWSSMLGNPQLGYPRHSAGFNKVKEAYRESKGRDPLRIGEEYDEDRGAFADRLIAGCKAIHRDVIMLTFELQLDDTTASKILSRGYCVRKKNGRPLPIDRKEYRALKHQGVTAFEVLYNALKPIEKKSA